MTITFARATRTAVKLKVGIDGPSGSGKTEGALALARGIVGPDGRIAVADSENESASLYSDRYNFDTTPIPDADPKTYRAIINAAVEARYDALVIDSISHAWQWVLAAKEDAERRDPRANGWTLWRTYGPMWDDLMKDILAAPIHIFATMRSKQAYEQTEQNGKKKIVKLGMQPQVREGAEYEFSLVFSVNISHAAEATKDRSGLFEDGKAIDLRDAKVHARLAAWMNTGGPATYRSAQSTEPDATAPTAVAELPRIDGKPIDTYSTKDLERIVTRHKNNPAYVKLVMAARTVLNDRVLGNTDDERLARAKDSVVADEHDLKFAGL